jgi:hypothetical protein
MKKVYSLGIITLLTLSGCNLLYPEQNPASYMPRESISELKKLEPKTNEQIEQNSKETVSEELNPTDEEINRKFEKTEPVRLYFELISKNSFFDDYSEEKWIGNMKEAYALKYKPTYDFEEFKRIYSDLESYRILKTDFDDKNSIATIIIELFSINKTSQLYKSEFRIIGNQIETVSAKIITGPYVIESLEVGPNKKVSIQWENGKINVVLDSNGKSTILESAEPNYEFVYGTPYFGEINTTTNPNFASYKVYGWEFSGLAIVDLNKGKKVVTLDFPAIAEFSSDNKYFISCAPAGMAGNYIDLYTVPDFKLTNKLPSLIKNDEYLTECNSFDKNTNTLNFTTMNSAGRTTETIRQFKF